MRKALIVAAAVAATVLAGAGIASAEGYDDDGDGRAPCSEQDGITVVNCVDAHDVVNLHDVVGHDALTDLLGDNED